MCLHIIERQWMLQTEWEMGGPIPYRAAPGLHPWGKGEASGAKTKMQPNRLPGCFAPTEDQCAGTGILQYFMLRCWQQVNKQAQQTATFELIEQMYYFVKRESPRH
jgi:hypothetical protein